jgi:hypothetical protein
MDTKVCSCCKAPTTLANMSRSNQSKDGLGSWCKYCKAASARRWLTRNKQSVNAKAKAEYALDGSKQREQASRWYAENKERGRQTRRAWKLLKKFAVTEADYQRMLEQQGGVCAICRGTQTVRLAVDHSHKTGDTRGLLCRRCNLGLGFFDDSPGTLMAAIAYLARSVKEVA